MLSNLNKLINKFRQYNSGFNFAILAYQNRDNDERVDFYLRIREEYLLGNSGTRLKEETKRNFLQMVYPGQNVNPELGKYREFTPVKSLQPGETWLTTYLSDSKSGAAYRMKLTEVKYSATSQLEGKSTTAVLRVISNFINDNITDRKFFVAQNQLHSYEPVLFDAFDTYVDEIKVKGRSHELPMAISLLSLIFNKALPVNIAFTGALNEFGKIERVSGLSEKIKAIIDEYPEVDTLFIPKQNEFDSYFRPNNIRIIAVDRFSDVVGIIYPDYQNIIAGDLKENIYFEVLRNVELTLPKKLPKIMDTPKAVLFRLKYSYVGELGTEVMNKLDLVDEISSVGRDDSAWLILDNVRPNWYVSFLSGKFYNKCSVFAVTSKSDGFQHAVVIFKRGDVGVKPGDKIPYKIIEQKSS